MSRYIDICFTAPPSMDAPIYVLALGEDGTELQVGSWLPPDNTQPFWRLRLNVAELLALLVTGERINVPLPGRTSEPTALQIERMHSTRGVELRQQLRERVSKLQPKKAPVEVMEQGAAAPGQVEALTADELAADAEEGGFDPSAVPEDPDEARWRKKADAEEGSSAPPFAQRLFDNTFHGKSGDSKGEDDDDNE